MPNQPQAFQVQRAARDVGGRQRQIDAAVDSAAGGGGPRNLVQGARQAASGGGGPGWSSLNSIPPMETDSAATTQVETEQNEMLQRMNAGEDPDAIRADIASRSNGEQLHELQNPTIGRTMSMARDSVNRMSAEDTPATPEENAEYDRALGGLSKILYEDIGTSGAIIDMLQPEEKVGSVAQATIMVLTQMDNKMDLNENVFAELTRETVDRIVDLGEQTKGMAFSDEDVRNALGAAWEGILQIYGDPDSAQADLEELTQGMSEEDVMAQANQYKQFLGE